MGFLGQKISVLSCLSGLLFLSACAVPPPRHPNNICDIYNEKRSWYYAAMREEAHWHIPSSVPMAMMYQESSFRSNVRTRRTYILWIIPWGHITSAYGYAQAENAVWKDYQKSIGSSASRSNFSDALNFMNWYITNTSHTLHVPVTDAMRQYLAYHEGWGGYKHHSYASKPSLMKIARRVQQRASSYERQYEGCKESLKGGFWERLWNWLF